MTIHFKKISEEDAAEIADWRYPGIYAMYNLKSEGKELLAPDLHYYVWSQGGHVCWFFCYGSDARVPGFAYDRHGDYLDIGWGLRPDLTGRGKGKELVECALGFIAQTTGSTSFRVTVAAFNERCLKTCRSAGFSDPVRFTRETDHREFVVLTAKKIGNFAKFVTTQNESGRS